MAVSGITERSTVVGEHRRERHSGSEIVRDSGGKDTVNSQGSWHKKVRINLGKDSVMLRKRSCSWMFQIDHA